jgi:hypothetical protein
MAEWHAIWMGQEAFKGIAEAPQQSTDSFLGLWTCSELRLVGGRCSKIVLGATFLPLSLSC